MKKIDYNGYRFPPVIIQRPTPPHFRFNASHFPRRGDEHVARGSHGCLKFQELPLIVLFRRQRDKAP
jgi:hypothetical protein